MRDFKIFLNKSLVRNFERLLISRIVLERFDVRLNSSWGKGRAKGEWPTGIRYICMLAGHGISKPERFYPFLDPGLFIHC